MSILPKNAKKKCQVRRDGSKHAMHNEKDFFFSLQSKKNARCQLNFVQATLRKTGYAQGCYERYEPQ